MKFPREHLARITPALGAFICLCLLLPSAWGGSAAARPSRPDSGEAEAARVERLAVFDEVWETVRARYYDPTMRGLDWAGVRAELRPLAARADGQTQLYAVLRRMLARLADPHTRVFAPDERSDWRAQRFVSVGLGVRELDGEFLVTSVVRGSEAESAGVRAGDRVVSVDGEEAARLVARRLEESGSLSNNAAARRRLAARLFEGPRDKALEAVFASIDGREKRVSLRRFISVRTPVLHVRRAGGGVRVVEFNVFTPEIAAQLVRAMKEELRGARAIVIDLRENGGGEAEALTDIASIFLPPGTKLGRFTDREGRVQSEPQTRAAMLSAADSIENFRGPLVVLTGARTASASEVFTAALKERGRATLIGETTCGCVLGIRRRHTLPDGGTLDISEADFQTANGTRLEGQGITPDRQTAPTRRDLLDGHDPAMRSALELLKRRKN